jgi:hypothetical protein
VRTSECISSFVFGVGLTVFLIFGNGAIFKKKHSRSALGQLRCQFCVTCDIQGLKGKLLLRL